MFNKSKAAILAFTASLARADLFIEEQVANNLNGRSLATSDEGLM